MDEKELEFSTRLTREDVAGLIEGLVEGLKDGVIKVHKSGETLELAVPRVVDLEIEAKINEERAEFEIEVSWRTNRAENPDAPTVDDAWSVCGKPESDTAAPLITPEAEPSQKPSTVKKTAATSKKTVRPKKTVPAKKKTPPPAKKSSAVEE